LKAKICVSLLPSSVVEAHSLIEKAEEIGSDLIELRLDNLEPTINFSELSDHGNIPKIATILSVIKNEKINVSNMDQQKILIQAAKSGFEFVDIGIDSPNLEKTIKKLKVLNCKPIVSFHDFAGSLSLSALENILDKEISSGAEVCKIVTTANKIQDNLNMLNFISQNSSKTCLVCFCMGKLGKTSRLLSPLYGGFFTFASLQEGSETANGQLSFQEMKKIYKILK
jgi:3-dehydroquinate dehydratase type I